MMRVIDQDTGLGFFTDNLLRTLLRIDQANCYLLLYKKPKRFGRFANLAKVKELLLPSGTNCSGTKFTVPLIERRRRCRWWRRSRSLAPEDMKSKHLLAFHA